MALPGSGIFVVQGEMTILITAMRRGTRWLTHSHQDEEHELLLKAFHDLKSFLSRVEDLKLINPNIFLEPFLEVIRSQQTTGPVTSLALLSVQKFLSYGLIDPNHESCALAIENIATAVTRARFFGTDAASDALVLLRIIHTIRSLLMSSSAHKLSDDTICDIALSCFKICYESRLNEVLRRTADLVLRDLVQIVFTRLSEFSEDYRGTHNVKTIKMHPNAIDQLRNKKRFKAIKKSKSNSEIEGTPKTNEQLNIEQSDQELKPPGDTFHLSTTPLISTNNNLVDMQGSLSQNLSPEIIDKLDIKSEASDESIKSSETKDNLQETQISSELQNDSSSNLENSNISSNSNESQGKNDSQEYVNPRGVRFTPHSPDGVTLIPYGIVSVREIFRFLISLCDPLDKDNNEVMIHLGLNLLTVAFEVGADHIGKFNSLLELCKDELCRNLFSLLSTERISIFAPNLQVSFLLFEALRTHLKFQLELYLTKLIEIIISDSVKVTYEHKQIALDNILQLWRIPGLVTELYLNYDCDFYCTNLFEDLTKLLAKNAFPVTAGVYHTHLLSLDALLTIIESIRLNCSAKIDSQEKNSSDNLEVATLNCDYIMGTRQKCSESIPSRDDLNVIKAKKRWLPQGTEYFNTKPKKGIQFLQEHGILSLELNPEEVVHFLRENPGLDKKMIGEYISSRQNSTVLEAFVKSFDFTDLRIDEALRLYLETFRLPGEAPLISLIMEQFAEHWHKCNGEPFANVDAAFTLAYAVIMLNVDQHNHNVKRQNTPMTPEEFKRNLARVNGNGDFDQDMLGEIYTAIKNEEIVMPAEQTGIVRENYLWKVLLRRGASKDGQYVHVPNGYFDKDLFSLIWGPTVAALSFVFDKSDDPLIYQRAIKGFKKCAFISAQFNMSSNLDTLILSLCKFTMLHSQQKGTYASRIQFASNDKAQIAFKTVLNIVHLHGDILHEGWSNVMDLILALYNHQLLPNSLLEAEDFTEPSGKITLVCETISSQKTETGLFSSLYSYMLSSDAGAPRVPTAEEQDLIEYAKTFIKESNLEQIITESKFLQMESLLDLVKSLIDFSKGPDGHKSLGTGYNENVTVFFLELLLKVVIQNRDRVMSIWQNVQDHIYSLIMGAATCDYQYLLERSLIGLLRLAIRLMRNEEMSPIILQSLRMLLLLKPITLYRISRQIAFGLFELLKTSAQNIHSDSDWKIIFTLLECIGAGSHIPKTLQEPSANVPDQGTKSDGEAPVSSEEDVPNVERGYTSDSELTRNSPGRTRNATETFASVPVTPAASQHSSGWILVGREGDTNTTNSLPKPQNTIVLERRLGPHNPIALLKCCESLAFLVRDVAHITPYNYEDCVRCIRTFVEASLNGNSRVGRHVRKDERSRNNVRSRKQENRFNTIDSGDDSEEEEDLPAGYHQISIQLLDLMHTLHTRTAQIFTWWAEEHGHITVTSLWPRGWCPLLQGIARLCCDSRKQVRMSALTYLQRALLMPDLQKLSGSEWEECFHRVLFPLLAQLLETPAPNSQTAEGLEEARMRAATVLSKVFLHHLTPLLTLPTFTSLWLTILECMDKYMHAGKSDLLYEAIPESLKNMLLVMDSAKVFNDGEQYSALWEITWNRINKFLPNLKDELFKVQPATKDEEQKDEENVQMQNEPVVAPNDVANATRNSIILQPSINDNIASPLFAHLGQMVSTPIGVPSTAGSPVVTAYSVQETSTVNASGSPLIQTQYYQTDYPLLYTTAHTSPPERIPSQIEPQPQALYNDYINNPYNVTDAQSTYCSSLVQDDYTNNPSNQQPTSNFFLPYINQPSNPSAIHPEPSNIDPSPSSNQPLNSSNQTSPVHIVPNSDENNSEQPSIFQSCNYFYTENEFLFNNEIKTTNHSNVVFYNPALMPDANIPLLPPSE